MKVISRGIRARFSNAAASGRFVVASKSATYVGIVLPDSPNGSDLLISNLIKLPPGFPEIKLEQALLASTGGNSLVAVNLRLDLDLKELPLVGHILRDLFPSAPLTVESLQFILADDALKDPKEIKKIRDLLEEALEPGLWRSTRRDVKLPDFKLPDTVAGGFHITGKYDLGGFKFPPDEESHALPPEPPTVDAAADHAKWIDVNKTFGPITVRRLGFKLGGFAVASAMLEASFRIPPLTFSLEGLGVGINPPAKDLSYHLSGAAVTADTGPVTVSGGLVKKSKSGEPLQIEGSLLVRAAGFTLSAFADYVDASTGPSFFAFAVLLNDLGGPPSFHVEGLALGVGLNRKFLLPDVSAVASFPLIKAVLESAGLEGIKEMRRSLPVAPGNFWLAAGVLFTSFKIVRSFALVSVAIGDDVELALLGLSRLAVQNEKLVLAFAELALRVVIRPAQGSIEVEGRLTNSSYIFNRDCTITGGFAFCSWFAGDHAGDFVITLGGYHPRFVRPPHYPQVPRLAVNWQAYTNLNVSGEMYYAITPSCLMAGGRISAVYRAGCVEAWFNLFADFLICWQPFHYDAAMGIFLGVSCSVRIKVGFCTISFTLRVTLGIGLQLYGPPFAGEARVDLSVVSFTLAFGQPEQPKALTPAQFMKHFLPEPNEDEPRQSNLIDIQIAGGLIRQDSTKKEAVHVVNALALALSIRSLIPLEMIEFDKAAERGESECGIPSVPAERLESYLRVWIESVSVSKPADVSASFNAIQIVTDVPAALWEAGFKDKAKVTVEAPDVKRLRATTGISATTKSEPIQSLGPIRISHLAVTDLPVLKWQFGKATVAELPQSKNETLWNTIADGSAPKQRKVVVDALRTTSPFLYTPDLLKMSTHEVGYFQIEVGPQNYRALGEELD
jgi:hypothetical protein